MPEFKANTHPDRLLALLALRNGMIGREALIEVLGDANRDRGRPLADHLVARGLMDPETRLLLEGLLARAQSSPTVRAALGSGIDPVLWAALDESQDTGTPRSPRITHPDATATGESGCEATGSWVNGARSPVAGSFADGPGPELSGSEGPWISGNDVTDARSGASESRSPSQASRYQILRPYARGNLGQVHVAFDTELGREVALKEILSHRVHDGRYRDRFVVEAQITGRLQHPGIVPVYGLGTYPDGRPYYAMRFIRGGSLKDAIERFHRGESPDPNWVESASTLDIVDEPENEPQAPGGQVLSDQSEAETDLKGGAPIPARMGPESPAVGLRRLLRRFQDVCNAVEYAHSRGVLHRDLKPANIVVGRHGETLVVDWGLAKATGRPEGLGPKDEPLVESSSGGGSETQAGQPLGTPAYASPEQLAGDLERVGPRTDIYGLGAVLYTLLTGKPPFESRPGQGPQEALREVIQAVQAGRFPTPRAADPTIPKPLEAVCLKAMALRIEDRYASARELGDEVERWLADEPVRARPEPFLERLRRWGRRHRTAVAAAAAALVMAVVGLGAVSTVQTWAKNELANKNLDLTRARNDLTSKNVALTQARNELVDQNLALDQQRRRAESRERQAIEAVGRFRDAIVDEPQLKKTPELKELRKRLLSEPMAFFRMLKDQLHSDGETKPESLARLASAAYDLGLLSNEIGDKEQALVASNEARDIRQKLVEANPEVAEFQYELAESLVNIGVLQDTTGQPEAALRSYQSALEIWQRLVQVNPEDTELQNDIATSLVNIGALQHTTGQPEAALRSYQSGLEIQQKLVRANPDARDFQFELARSHNNLGLLQSETGQLEAASRSFESALEIQKKLVQANPEVTKFQSLMAMSHNNLGLMQSETGQPEAALRSFESALEIRQKLAQANPSVTEFQSTLAKSHNNIGVLRRDTGQLEAALRSFESALEIQQKLVQANPKVIGFQGDLAKSHNNIGLVQSKTGQPEAALQSYQSALEIQQKLAQANPEASEFQSDLAASVMNIGILQSETGQPDAALRSFESGVEIWQKLVQANPSVTEFQSDLAASLLNVGVLQRATGQPDAALRSYQSALEIQQKLAQANPSVTEFQSTLAKSHNRIGVLRRATGQLEAALRSFESALEIQQKLVQANPKVIGFQGDLAKSHNNIGLVQSETSQPEAALRSYQSALEIRLNLRESEPSNSDNLSELGDVLNSMALIDLKFGRIESAWDRLLQAIDWQRQVLASHPDDPQYRESLKSYLTNLIRAAEALELTEEAVEVRHEMERLDRSAVSP